MAQTFETFCPLFPGFYGTHFEYNSEDVDIESYNEEYKTNLKYDDFEWDYKEYHERVAKAFVNRLQSELSHFLPIRILFQRIHSPREYNFENDSIYVTITLDLDKLIRLIKKRSDSAMLYFLERYSSRSGFISFHSKYLSDWLNKKYILENPGHRVGALLDCLATIEIDRDDIIYWTDGESHIDFTPKESDVLP